MTTDPTSASPRDRAEFALREKLNRVLLYRQQLREERRPVPPALEEVVGELRQAMGLEPPLPVAGR